MTTKAIILTPAKHDIDYLNELLANGWTVSHSCPMPSSSGNPENTIYRQIAPTCLVVLQKA